jgi:hypothetical protein
MKLKSNKNNNQSSLIDNQLEMLSTYVERTLQIHPFFCKTNPIFLIFRLKMMISLKNKPNSNPKQTQSNPILAQKSGWQSQTNPKQSQLANWTEINISSFITSKYENLYRWKGKKNKPKQVCPRMS